MRGNFAIPHCTWSSIMFSLCFISVTFQWVYGRLSVAIPSLRKLCLSCRWPARSAEASTFPWVSTEHNGCVSWSFALHEFLHLPWMEFIDLISLQTWHIFSLSCFGSRWINFVNKNIEPRCFLVLQICTWSLWIAPFYVVDQLMAN